MGCFSSADESAHYGFSVCMLLEQYRAPLGWEADGVVELGTGDATAISDVVTALPGLRVRSFDISATSVDAARANIAARGIADRYVVELGDFFDQADSAGGPAGGHRHLQPALHPRPGPGHPDAGAVGRDPRQRPGPAAAQGRVRQRHRRRRQLLRPADDRPDRRGPRLPGRQLPRHGPGLRPLQQRAQGPPAHPRAVRPRVAGGPTRTATWSPSRCSPGTPTSPGDRAGQLLRALQV